MADWRARADALDEVTGSPDRPNEAWLSRTLRGRGELRGSFDPATTELIDTAVRLAQPSDTDVPAPERRADAIAQICQHFLDHQQTRAGGRHRPHVNVVLTAAELASGIGGRYADTGEPVPPDHLGVLLCDSALHRLLVDAGGAILDYGRATRQWPADLYNAIVLRDGVCRYGTCTTPPSWCDVHHVDPLEHGGATSIDNGILACRRHHTMTHRPGYHLKLLPDGTVEFTHPDGHVETSHPRGPIPPQLPLGSRRPGRRRRRRATGG
jgi:hypothetical protein